MLPETPTHSTNLGPGPTPHLQSARSVGLLRVGLQQAQQAGVELAQQLAGRPARCASGQGSEQPVHLQWGWVGGYGVGVGRGGVERGGAGLSRPTAGASLWR